MATTFKGDGFSVESGFKDGKFTITVIKDEESPDNVIVAKYKSESGQVKGLTIDDIRKNIKSYNPTLMFSVMESKPVTEIAPSFLDQFIDKSVKDLKSQVQEAIGRDPLPDEIDFTFDGHRVSALLKNPFEVKSIPTWCKIPESFFQRENPLKEYETSNPFLHLFDHDSSQILTKLKLGQTVFFFGQEGRVWDGVIEAIRINGCLVRGKELAWFPFDLLYTSLSEAYQAQDKEIKSKSNG